MRRMSLALIAIVLGCFSSAQAGYAIRVIASEDAKSVTDEVAKVSEDKEGVAVAFSKTSGNYHMKRDVRKFAKFKKKLAESMSVKKPVTVTLDAAGLNILEVK